MDHKQLRNLESYLATQYPELRPLSIGQVSNISDGWESEMHSFILRSGPGTSPKKEKRVLRIYPGDNAVEKSQHESISMKRLWEADYPVPRIFMAESNLDVIGRPFVIMEWIEGRVMWPMLDKATKDDRSDLIKLFCSLFVRLHQMDWEPFVANTQGLHQGSPFRYVDKWFLRAEAMLEQYPVIDLRPVLDWLSTKRMALACQSPSPVHQDFHPGNILVSEDLQGVVIDWTGFEVTDIRFDLAWTLMLVDAYAGRDLRDEILTEYERNLGDKVGEIETFEVFACSRRLFDVFVSLSEGAERLGMRPEAIEAMRQHMYAVERVYRRLRDLTGIDLPDVDGLIAQELSSSSPF